jgi:CHAD domain-containing protein
MVNRRSRILLFVLHQLEVFHKNYELALLDADIEAVHDMRVAVKKLRAACLLLGDLDKSGTMELELKEIKPLYRASGKLRDLQLKKELLARNFRSSRHQAIHDFIFRMANHHKQEFLELALSKRGAYFKKFAAVSENVLNKCSESEFNHLIQNKISSHVHTARMYVANAVCIRDYHLARRYIKQVFHLMMMSGIVSWSDLQARFTRRNLKSLEESIGNWHDHVQLKLWMESLRGGVELPTWLAVHTHFHVKSERMLGRAVQKFRSIAGLYA